MLLFCNIESLHFIVLPDSLSQGFYKYRKEGGDKTAAQASTSRQLKTVCQVAADLYFGIKLIYLLFKHSLSNSAYRKVQLTL